MNIHQPYLENNKSLSDDQYNKFLNEPFHKDSKFVLQDTPFKLYRLVHILATKKNAEDIINNLGIKYSTFHEINYSVNCPLVVLGQGIGGSLGYPFVVKRQIKEILSDILDKAKNSVASVPYTPAYESIIKGFSIAQVTDVFHLLFNIRNSQNNPFYNSFQYFLSVAKYCIENEYNFPVWFKHKSKLICIDFGTGEIIEDTDKIAGAYVVYCDIIPTANKKNRN